jgi:hypothetical protein
VGIFLFSSVVEHRKRTLVRAERMTAEKMKKPPVQ